MRQLLLCFAQLAKCRFPAPLQFRGDETVLRIDLLVLPLRSTRRITQALHLLTPRREDRRAPRVRFRECPRRQVERGWRQRLEEPAHHLLVNRCSPQPLTNRFTVLLPQVVTEILRASLVLHAQLVAALAAVDDAVEQRLSVARHAAGFVA